MTTAISVISRSEFTALSPAAELSEAMTAMAETGEQLQPSDLIRVPTPSGGATTWTIPNPVQEEQTKEIVGLLVYYQPVGILWPGTDPAPGAMPVLRTFEPLNPRGLAEQIGPIPGSMMASLEKCRVDDRHFRWNDLPYNQWGSGKGGIGKLCKEQRQMFILRPGDAFPLLVTAQPGSVKDVGKFFKLLAPTAGVPYYRCVVSLTLEQAMSKGGQKFAKIVCRLRGTVDAETGEIVRTRWTEVLRTMARRIDVDAGEAGGDE